MTFKYGAIPTVYKGIRFRSRTEARWAAFFDAVGWKWDYEPYDLGGWIPDFVLHFRKPVLVEVKPASSEDELLPHAGGRQLAHCPNGTLLLGSGPIWDPYAIAIGLEITVYDWALPTATAAEQQLLSSYSFVVEDRFPSDRDERLSRTKAFAAANEIPYGRTFDTTPAWPFVCACGSMCCGTMCVCSGGYSTGKQDGVREAWAKAQNATQWKGSR